MYFVGVDLAWGLKGITGLAVADESGRLLAATERRTDDEILEWLRPWTDGPCLVAMDAPLVVRNATGNRPCESLVTKYFGKYNAGCHSSSLALPHFADGGRAYRLALELGLRVDSLERVERQAVEVYPHPAIVALFGLPKILQYKDKPGRDASYCRSELLRLLDFLEGLPLLDVSRCADWDRIRTAVSLATRKVELARVEDSIDAIVCAYIAHYAHHQPDAVRPMGDAETGYILTPVTPDIATRYDAALPHPSPA
ncbi:DUF429 domain-containing protein [Kribbella deserti]|uniref:DUF429 domain-containing protein n=1 Tax=Kribbella deserti TaxID=1926257 RepID=A0ABV6QP34_9ACTN